MYFMDMFRRYRKTEIRSVMIFRIFTMILIILLLLAYMSFLTYALILEVPIVKYKTVEEDSFPAPGGFDEFHFL